MKFPALMLLISFLFNLHASAQNGIRFEENKLSRNMADLFLFSYKPDSLLKDSFRVSIYSNRLKKDVRQYLLIYDSIFKITRFADSVVCDCYPRKKEGDVLTVSLYEVSDTSVTLLSIFNSTVSVEKKQATEQPFKIKGQVRSDNYFSDGYFDFQAVPRNYSRTSLDMQLSVGDLPFRTGFFYTTESHNMNSFYFSFDYAQYKNNLLKKLNEKKKAELNGETDLQTRLDRIELDKSKLTNSISSPSYSNKLSESRNDLAYGLSDSAFRKTKRYQKAEAFMRTDSLKRMELAGFDGLKDKLTLEEYNRNPAFYTRDAISDDRKLRETLDKQGIRQPGFGFINSIRRFDIGTFTPRYSTLIIDAIQLNGVNAELNSGLAYAAVCVGELKSGFVNSGAEEAYRSTVMMARAGIKRENRYSLVFTGMRGNGRSYFYNTGSPNPYLSNQLLGIEGTYYIGKNMGLRSELAASEVQTEQARPYEISAIEQKKQQSPAFSAAGLLSLFWHSKNEGTQAEALYQQTGPGYFSIATPYIRKDNRRTELKLNQRIYKSYISVFGTARLESDNLFKTKQGTTYTTILTSGIKLMPKGLPYVILSYSPLWQHSRPAPGISITNRMDLYSITTGYSYSGKHFINTSTINYVRNSTYLFNLELNRQLLTMNTFVVSNILQYKPSQTQASISVTSMNHMMSGHYNDSLTFTQSRGFDLGITQKLGRLKSAAEAGYSYITFIPDSYRHGMRIGTSTSFAGFTLNLRAEKYFTRKQTYTTMNVFRITLIKSF
ncbi:MAG: hypothetical protein V4658_06920 [Bacteroidota bacterium]